MHVTTNVSYFCLTSVFKIPSRFANRSRNVTFTQKWILGVNDGKPLFKKMYSRGRLWILRERKCHKNYILYCASPALGRLVYLLAWLIGTLIYRVFFGRYALLSAH